MSDSDDHQFAALDQSIKDLARRTRLGTQIYARVRALMRENGLTYGYCEEKALAQATFELTGVAAK